jgi:putative sigma-54 modulation protein
MQIIISGRGVTLTPAIKTLAERKIGKLGKLLPAAVGARLVCSAEKFRRKVRLTLSARRHTFATVVTADDLMAAVDLAVDALARQVREQKDRRRDLARVSRARPAGGAEAEVEVAPSAPVVDGVVTERLTAKPMSTEEAVLQFGLNPPESFLVFRNARTEDVNVLYRRRDGALGLIEPVV